MLSTYFHSLLCFFKIRSLQHGPRVFVCRVKNRNYLKYFEQQRLRLKNKWKNLVREKNVVDEGKRTERPLTPKRHDANQSLKKMSRN